MKKGAPRNWIFAGPAALSTIDNSNHSSVVVRLEGGVGDHILGMRVLSFVKDRFPHNPLTVLSDCGGNDAQAEIAAMSPLVDRVVKATHRRQLANVTEMGRLDNLDEDALCYVKRSHAFVDAWGAHFFLEASQLLQVPLFEILARRPALVPSAISERAAAEFLAPYAGRILVTMNLSKWGAGLLAKCWQTAAAPLLQRILSNSEVIVVNLFTTRFEYSQWPEDLARYRKALLQEEAQLLATLPKIHDRLISAPDLGI